MSLFNPITRIECKFISFLIFDAPSDINIHLYIEQCKKNNVKHFVRVCESSYNPSKIIENGMKFHDLEYSDGLCPPPVIISEWKKIISDSVKSKTNIAIHCIAGLGRAPQLVCTYLIDTGMTCDDAVTLIRNKRRGAINARQLYYLRDYKRNSNNKNSCIII